MMAWLLKLLPGNLLAEVLGFLVETAVIIGLTWHFVAGHYEAKEAADLAQAQAKAAADYAALTQKYDSAETQLTQAQANHATVYHEITHELQTVIHDPVLANVCLSDDGVRLINAALSGKPPASAATAASAVPPASAASGN